MLPKSTMMAFAGQTFGPEFKQARWVNQPESELLREWVRAANPDVVLESGTANGYSTIWMASGLSDKAVVHTFDPIDRAKVWPLLPEAATNIHFHQSEFRNVRKYVPLVEGKILAFIDGDHGILSVLEDWEALLPYLKPNDVVLFHDIGEASVLKALKDILQSTPTSRLFTFDTRRGVGVLIYKSQTIPVCDETKEPLVIHLASEIKGPEKVRDTIWADEEKPWAAYDTKALHTSVECHLLYRTAKRLGTGLYANLGTYKGMSSACLAFGAGSDSKVYCVDDYELETIKGIYPEKMIVKFKELGLPEPIICRGLTTDFPRKLQDARFRFIFIDAGHRYKDIKDDFEMWTPLLEPDGEVGIHDCEYSNIHKYIEEDVLKNWELVEHVWRTKIFRRKQW